MNDNLPQKVKMGIIYKVKSWLMKIMNRNTVEVQVPIVEDTNIKIHVKDDFIDTIKKQTNMLAETLQEKLKSGELRARDLSDDEYEEVIALYDAQITTMSNKLREYKEKIATLRKV